MNDLVGRSIGWGAVFGAMGSFATASCYLLFWMAKGGYHVEYGMAMIFWLPAMAIMGCIGGAVLFGVVGAIMRFYPRGMASSPLSYAVLGTLLALGIALTYGLREQGLHLYFMEFVLPRGDHPGVLWAPIAGLLIGWKVRPPHDPRS